jgi:hypothetical protein
MMIENICTAILRRTTGLKIQEPAGKTTCSETDGGL